MAITALTREQVRRVDRIATDEYGIPGIVLMENAALGVVASVMSLMDSWEQIPEAKPRQFDVAIVCGGGNNGGDGYAIARLLFNKGIPVRVYAVSDPKKLIGDAATNRHLVENMSIECVDVLDELQIENAAGEWRQSRLMIDAILGTGFSCDMRPHVAHVIAEINRLADEEQISVLAVDLPSGLDCDTGIPSAQTIVADVTVTFVAPKAGFATPAAQEFLGEVAVAGIGAPTEIVERVLRETGCPGRE